jgi:hypothetical protein
MHPALLVVLGNVAAVVLLSWAYFRRYRLARPPIGVMNLRDVAAMIGAVILVPYLYLVLPLWLVAGLFVMLALSVLIAVGEPVLANRPLLWVAILAVVGADVGTGLRSGTVGLPFLALNDIVLTVLVVGLTNLWAQSGMRARDVAILAGVLSLYDMVATGRLPLTTDLMARLAGLPLAPLVAWGMGSARLEVGLGDLLLAAVFPLVMRKAFGRAAGRTALVVTLGTMGTLLVVLALRGEPVALPTMTVLGPLMVVQYVWWVRRSGVERTTWQYRQAEALSGNVQRERAGGAGTASPAMVSPSIRRQRP